VGSIERTPAGTWKARYRDPQGRSRRKTFKRKRDAERRAGSSLRGTASSATTRSMYPTTACVEGRCSNRSSQSRRSRTTTGSFEFESSGV
jgi:hypothetical protein